MMSATRLASMEARREQPVVVVGAGISGLTCAWRLRREGVNVVCLDPSDRVGGALRSHAKDGFLLEAGASTILETPELVDLITEVGLAKEIIRAAARLPRYILRGGSLHALPTGLGSLLRTRLLSAGAKWRILGELWTPPSRATEDESVDAFIRRRFGEEIGRVIVAPFVSGTFAGDPTALSARSVLPRLVDLERRYGGVIKGMLGMMRSARPHESSAGRRSLISLRDGMESLPRRLAQRLGEDVRLRARAEAIRRDAQGAWVVSVRRGEEAMRLSGRAVVLATPAGEAARLLADASPPASTTLTEVTSASLAVVSLGWPRAAVSHGLHGLGFLTVPGEQRRILGCLWPSSTFAERAPSGSVCFTAFVGGTLDPQAASLGDEALGELVRHDLSQVLGISGPPRVLSIDRYRQALPQYGIGHAQRGARAREAIDRVPGLFVCGNYFSGVSVGECVRAAQETAAGVFRYLG